LKTINKDLLALICLVDEQRANGEPLADRLDESALLGGIPHLGSLESRQDDLAFEESAIQPFDLDAADLCVAPAHRLSSVFLR
jgi:hypothetical protein